METVPLMQRYFPCNDLVNLESLTIKDRIVYLTETTSVVTTICVDFGLTPIVLRSIFFHPELSEVRVVHDPRGCDHVLLTFSVPVALFRMYKAVNMWNIQRTEDSRALVRICNFEGRPLIRKFVKHNTDPDDYTIRKLYEAYDSGDLRVIYIPKGLRTVSPRRMIPMRLTPPTWDWSDEQQRHLIKLWNELWPTPVIARVVCPDVYTPEYERFVGGIIEKLLATGVIRSTSPKIKYAADVESIHVAVKWLKWDWSMGMLVRAAEAIEDRPMEAPDAPPDADSAFALTHGEHVTTAFDTPESVRSYYPVDSLVYSLPEYYEKAWDLFKNLNLIRSVSNDLARCMALLRKKYPTPVRSSELVGTAFEVARFTKLRLSILLEVVQSMQATTRYPGISAYQFHFVWDKCQGIVASEMEQVAQYVRAFEKIICAEPAAVCARSGGIV